MKQEFLTVVSTNSNEKLEFLAHAKYYRITYIQSNVSARPISKNLGNGLIC